MKTLLFGILGFCFALTATAQDKYVTRSGEIRFESNAEVDDDVRAINNQVAVVFNKPQGQLGFQLLIKSFEFKKALMQEHFNENYMESDKFPKATFKGTVQNMSDVDLSDGKPHEMVVKGDMMIHGVTNAVTEKATFQMVNGKVKITSTQKITLADYGISVPDLVSDKLAKVIDVYVQAQLESPSK